MAERTSKDRQGYYICGQCRDKIYNLISDKFDIPCPDCGWAHGSKRKEDIPRQVKLDLQTYA